MDSYFGIIPLDNDYVVLFSLLTDTTHLFGVHEREYRTSLFRLQQVAGHVTMQCMGNRKALLIGYGNIGKAVEERLGQIDAQLSGIIRSDGLLLNPKTLEPTSQDKNAWKDQKPDIVFVSMPSTETGKEAFAYIDHFASKGVPVVTAEKGAMANKFHELKPYLDTTLGVSATVGGGTRMMQVLKERINRQVNQVHLVLNGTLNFILDGVSRGQSFGQVVEQAQSLGYAEPGAASHLDVINGETIGDVPKKISILWNYTESPNDPNAQYVNWKDFKQPAITKDILSQLIAEANIRRYIVSWYREPMIIPKNDILSGFEYKIGDWRIVGGFQRVDRNPLFAELSKAGPSNGMVIATGKDERDGVYVLSGPGAGPGPTSASMIQDASKLLSISKG